ncbi:MAG: phospho-N-acetylmuramoyl-pentapeptide-transferase [Candidatus Abyssobacteria bacterium SURF_17]|uniref:Phospho-N-acetylmuramoyl-pentapeptide-transferase n=1 Tax=Candidatus Abyssobacteria bacterium SURF_17 TaxID=2093361 RepID=A0A419F7N9_9BACT|nr:MAG: phospho-N-acetylmuramoyl-pentapeptide-transferase [Candidatus Abyssubacteria bacterium SURF_17]
MLHLLLTKLIPVVSAFNIFTYITFRSALAAMTSLALSVLLGPWVIRKLKELKIGQQIRKEYVDDLHKIHQYKAGTPTMGGLLIIIAVVIATALWANLQNRLVVITLLCMCWLGFVGFLDDYIKMRKKRSLGLTARFKLLSQIALGLALGVYLYYYPVNEQYGTKLEILFFKDTYLSLGLLYIPFVILVIVGASNAVNLTDGLDGLAIGSVIMASLAYTGMAYLVGRSDFARYLFVTHVVGAGELTIFMAALAGAGLGFLWYNAYPAEVFMGDTGSLALGGVLGTVAVLIKQELLLVLVGGLFVLEAASVIIQVLSYRLRGGKRVFKMAPLHHHFELLGWSETKVTVRFWIIAAMFALLSLSTLKVR